MAEHTAGLSFVSGMKHLCREIRIENVANNKSSDHKSPRILGTPSQYCPTQFPRNKADLSGSQKNSTGSFAEQDLFADAREMWLPFKELFHHRHSLLFLIFQAI